MERIMLPGDWGIYESKINDFHSRFIIFNKYGHNKAEFFTENPQDITSVIEFAKDMNSAVNQLRVAVEALEKISHGVPFGSYHDRYFNLTDKARAALEQIKE